MATELQDGTHPTSVPGAELAPGRTDILGEQNDSSVPSVGFPRPYPSAQPSPSEKVDGARGESQRREQGQYGRCPYPRTGIADDDGVDTLDEGGKVVRAHSVGEQQDRRGHQAEPSYRRHDA